MIDSRYRGDERICNETELGRAEGEAGEGVLEARSVLYRHSRAVDARVEVQKGIQRWRFAVEN